MDPNKLTGGFFRSLTSSFKSANSDREKIDAASITDDLARQQIINELKRGSPSQRAKAAEFLSECLYELSPNDIPKIWYCAKDMISPNTQHQVRQAGLRLFSQCASLPTDDPEARYTYFSDALVNCHFTKDKVDVDFSQFFNIIKILTDSGYFIHHYQESLKKPLLEWFITALSPTDMARSKTTLELFSFIIDCIKSGIFSTDDQEEASKHTEELLSITIKLALRTSDKQTLEACIQLIDILINNQTIPESMMYETLEIVCGASILDMSFFDLATSVVMNLINSKEASAVFSTLLEIITCKKSKATKNINGSIGALKIMGFLFPKFAYQISTYSLLKTLNEVITWNKPNLNITILKFLNETLLDGLTLDQIAAEQWDSDEVSILALLSNISEKLTKGEESDVYKLVLVQLQGLAETSRYPGTTKKLIQFFVANSAYLSAKGCLDVLRYYSMENLCSPLNPSWKSNFDMILTTFFYDDTKDFTVRVGCVKLILDVFNSTLLNQDETTSLDVAELMTKALALETTTEVVKIFTSSLIEILPSVSNSLYQHIIEQLFAPRLFSLQKRRSSLAVSVLGNGEKTPEYVVFSDKTASQVTQLLVTLFCHCMIADGRKSAMTFNVLIDVANNALSKKNADLLLITSRLFTRIRVSATKQVYLTSPTDMDGLSAAFGRNLNLRKVKEANISSLTLDEKWTYPEEIDYIPSDTLDKPSGNLTIVDNSSDKLITTPMIDIEKWLAVVIHVLESCPDWEVYSFMYAHFCPQLSNITLFESCGDGIRRFRSLVCDQLQLKLPQTLKIPSNMNRQDLQIAIVRNFTPLVSYHGIFSKQDEDEIIGALLVGLSAWEKTAIPCIHILTVCCYELPLSVKKYISVILTKLQTRISSAFASAHILEFLLSLSYIPSLTSNLTVDEFKRAFGITFKLIQYAHEISEVKENQHQGVLAHGAELSAEVMPSTESLEITPVISIYLLSLSYDIIANWFLNMKLSDRRKLSSFIMKNLIISQSNRGSEINNQNMSFLDLITRFTYSDMELNFSSINPKKFDEDVQVLSSKWVYGNSIVWIETKASTGESIVSVRRASGSTVFRITPDESMIPVYTSQLHSRDDDDMFTANYILLQLLVQADATESSKPIPIPDDPSFARSIANFDRIPVVGFHKIGLLYIGSNQTTEQEILGNSAGSLEFDQFLKKLGRPIALKGCKSFYVGGLDTENDVDGEIAYGWNDKILQLIFHTTTLMPSSEEDPLYSGKKRHIGNNYVNIFFDESGLPFDFNVIKSQFNFLNIVISPHSISFDKSSLDKTHIKKYKVKIHRRSGVPGLFATCHFKIISEENLPTFVRTLALVADQFAQVWHSNGNYASNWSHRMRQLLQIKEKAVKAHEQLRNELHDENANKQKTSSGQGFLSQISSHGNGDSIKRTNSITRPTNTNQYEFTEEDENTIFKSLEFTSFTK